MKTRTVFALLLGVGLMFGCGSVAQADNVPVNTKALAGYDKLYADINKDGKPERFSLVGKDKLLRKAKQAVCYEYYVVVKDSRGKELSRSDTFEFINNPKYCMLRDIDNDGCVELIFSIEQYDNHSDIATPYVMFKWRNEAIRGYERRSNQDYPNVTINQNKNGTAYEVNADVDDNGNNGLYCLRLVDGNIWGDIVEDSFSADEPEKIPPTLNEDERLLKYKGTTYLCKTVRLVPGKGGLRIVENKKF